MNLREFQREYDTDSKCLDRIFAVRAAKEEGGCIRCGQPLRDLYKRIKGKKEYLCKNCLKHVSVMSGTPMEASKVSPKIWFHVMADLFFSKNGVSAREVSYTYGLSYETAWLLLHKIRRWMGMVDSAALEKVKLCGIVEVDESYVVTGAKGMKQYQTLKRGPGSERTTPYLALAQRHPRKIEVNVTPNGTEATILPIIKNKVEQGSKISTDEAKVFRKVESMGYGHVTTNHSEKQYVNGEASTNIIEGFNGNFKRSIDGTHHCVSAKWLSSYTKEHVFRYNHRRQPQEMLGLMLDVLPPLFDHERDKKQQKVA